jgi:predicted DCC family thiol-disulfide oxidoreductase YuxK
MERWTLIYDGDCEFCRRQVRMVERWDTQSRIEPVPFQQAELDSYGVSREAVEEAMHLVSPSETVWRGSAAAREILRLLPRGRLLAWLFRLPGAMFMAERAYRWIAKRRHRFGCDSVVCRRGTDGT